MSLKQALLQEFDAEMRYTRIMLERVPEEKFSWKPHEKSMTLGWLATFLAIIPTWGVSILEGDSFDPAPPGAAPQRPAEAGSRQELLEMFDRNAAAVRSALAATSDEHLEKPWTLLGGGQVIFTQPRMLVFSTYFLNHTVHHRAQLGLYLRLNNITVPAIYSGSADEAGGMFMQAPVIAN